MTTDTELLDALSALIDVGAEITVRPYTARGENPGEFTHGVIVSGAGLGGAFHTDLREALADHFDGISRLAPLDPWFTKYNDAIRKVTA